MYEIENIKSAIVNSPLKATKNSDIKGAWIKRHEGDYWICNDCLSRLMARGIRIDNIEMVWNDPGVIFGVCICCE